MDTMITQHMLARRVERHEGLRAAGEITLSSRASARRERLYATSVAAPEGPAPRRPARSRRAWAWARALTA
jgi:hypothetical protein